MNKQLLAIVAAALTAKTTERRWQNAIKKAAENLPVVSWRIVDGRLVVASPSGQVYSANRKNCQCAAFVKPIEAGAQPKACWHRAGFVIATKLAEVEGVLN